MGGRGVRGGIKRLVKCELREFEFLEVIDRETFAFR